MSYVLYWLTFFLGLAFPRNKLITFLIIGYIFLLMAFNTYNADYGNYESMYVFVGLGEYSGWIKDFGYIFLVEQANRLGLNYQEFLIVFFAICAIILLGIVKKYSMSPNSVLSFIMLYPLFINIIQLRTFLAILVIIYAIQYLNKYSFKNVVKYLLYLSIATSLHLSSAFFIILLLAYIRKRTYLLLIGIVAILVLASSIPFVMQIINTFTEGKLDSYSESNYVTLNKTMRVLFFGISSTFLVLYMRYFMKRHFLFNHQYDGVMARCALLVLPVSVIAILFSNEFERFSRVGYILIYIMFFNIFNYKTVNLIDKLKLVFLFIISIFSYIFFQYYFRFSDTIPFSEAVFKTIIEYNSIIGVNYE